MPVKTFFSKKLLLSVTGAIETLTGLLLLVAPSLLSRLLLGTELGTQEGLAVGRVAGAALVALGIVCWFAREHVEDPIARGLVIAMLVYNAIVAGLLALVWLGQGLFGILLLPVVIVHLALAVWCIAYLPRRLLD